MGFRNLYWFNQALIAKNVWRVIRSLGSLAGRVLKESSFPEPSILEAHISSSSTWLGLVWGREVITRGSRWRIGADSKVDARSETFIPRSRNLK